MKERLDVFLVEKGYFTSREKAKASIMAGIIFINGQRVDKAGTMIKTDSEILIKGNQCPYVSRGGLKLEKGIENFGFNLNGIYAMDMGASTGGFTDCMLQNGAKKVYSIDVGYGQLDYKLRIDERVVNMEKTNIRYLDTDLILEKIDFISIDVSFISLKLMFPVASKVMADDGKILCLVKPQFEAGREQVGKKGIIRDKNVHKDVIKKVIVYAAENGLFPNGLTFSPVTGAKGNIEYLLFLSKEEVEFSNDLIDNVVESSHKELDK